MGTKAKIKYGITSLNLNIILLQQVIVNAYDDLRRIRNYHPIDYPNYVKEAAYIAYWFSQKKPVSICDDELMKVIDNYDFSDYQKLKLININDGKVTVRCPRCKKVPKVIVKGKYNEHIIVKCD